MRAPIIVRAKTAVVTELDMERFTRWDCCNIFSDTVGDENQPIPRRLDKLPR